MSSLTRLFRLLQITRAQALQGYALAEIPRSELSDLAQHHYLVTVTAWQLGRLLMQKGCTVDTAKILEYALVHDLGELFGGDISMPYAKANPAARAAAKQFEAENVKYLATFFTEPEYFQKTSDEATNPTSLEGIVAKIADYLEITHYKAYVHCLTEGDVILSANQIEKKLELIQDSQAKKVLKQFLENWKIEMSQPLNELFEDSKRLR